MLKLTKEQQELIKLGQMVVTEQGRKFYFLPFWFEDMGDGLFEEYNLEFLPDVLKEALKENREEKSGVTLDLDKFKDRVDTFRKIL